VGNEERSIEDIINFQEGRGEIPDFQVGKGNEMRLSKSIRSSEMSLGQQRVLAGEEEEVREMPHEHNISCGVTDHMNEDDEKLNNSTLKEEDQK
jgi:hypothetical protein